MAWLLSGNVVTKNWELIDISSSNIKLFLYDVKIGVHFKYVNYMRKKLHT